MHAADSLSVLWISASSTASVMGDAASNAASITGGILVLSLSAVSRFSENASQVLWQGRQVLDIAKFDDYMCATVAGRLEDAEQGKSFEADMRALAGAGVATSTLENLLGEQTDRKPWEVGEALAECVLEEERGVRWPWNMERDKRTPKASLPGADIVGFLVENEDVYLALGEVKTSFDSRQPPEVLQGRSGMISQLDNLARNPALHMTLLNWLHARCKLTSFWPLYQKAAQRYLSSEGRDLILFGLLMRDTEPHERDLTSRAQNLAHRVVAPTRVELTAWYLPRPIPQWPQIAAGSA